MPGFATGRTTAVLEKDRHLLADGLFGVLPELARECA
jgi:hypothetical protein